LEYNILEDDAYCLYCYIFRPDIEHQIGGDSFVTERFKNWKKNEKLLNHMGAHNIALAIFFINFSFFFSFIEKKNLAPLNQIPGSATN
jgi:hypothetical protein